MMGWILGRDSVGYSGANILILAGEGMVHREYDIFIFWGTGRIYILCYLFLN